MNRIKYEQYHGAAGYDAVARKKIKELEEKVGTGGSGGGAVVFKATYDAGEALDISCSHSLDEAYDLIYNCKAPVIVRIRDTNYDTYCVSNNVRTLCAQIELNGVIGTKIHVRFGWITPHGTGYAAYDDSYFDWETGSELMVTWGD